jgi:hypothetical protein
LASALGSAGRIEEAKAALAKAVEVEPRFLTKGFINVVWPSLDQVFRERCDAGIDKIRSSRG